MAKLLVGLAEAATALHIPHSTLRVCPRCGWGLASVHHHHHVWDHVVCM